VCARALIAKTQNPRRQRPTTENRKSTTDDNDNDDGTSTSANVSLCMGKGWRLATD